MTEIHGTCDEQFEAVRDAFSRNFEQELDVGASVAVVVEGETVVDLWAGHADEAGRPWERDTIVNVYSTTKTMTALSALVLADRGEIEIHLRRSTDKGRTWSPPIQIAHLGPRLARKTPPAQGQKEEGHGWARRTDCKQSRGHCRPQWCSALHLLRGVHAQFLYAQYR